MAAVPQVKEAGPGRWEGPEQGCHSVAKKEEETEVGTNQQKWMQQAWGSSYADNGGFNLGRERAGLAPWERSL